VKSWQYFRTDNILLESTVDWLSKDMVQFVVSENGEKDFRTQNLATDWYR